MKRKKLEVFRPEYEITVSKPILGRLMVLFLFLKTIRLFRLNIMIGNDILDRRFYLCIPKFRVDDAP